MGYMMGKLIKLSDYRSKPKLSFKIRKLNKGELLRQMSKVQLYKPTANIDINNLPPHIGIT